MLTTRKWFVVSALLLLAMFVGLSTASAARCDVHGLVFIDTNENGVWDVGEAGYGGKLLWDEDQEVERYVGTKITVITPAYDEFELESAGYRELNDTGGPLPAAKPEVLPEVTQQPMPAIVEGTGFVPGMVFIDTNLNGIWDIGEAGYGGELTWIKKDNESRYVGATITLISPAYDEFKLTSAGHRTLEEGEVMPCTQQDLVYEGDLNPHPVRPCVGTWGLPHAGDDIRWEVWLTTPTGYKVTSANPQYFTTGQNSVPVDFGIAPID